MTSDLFIRASMSLSSAEEKRLSALRQWLQALPDGDGLVENLESESHLVGDADFGDPAELRSFLLRCAEEHANGANETDRAAGHDRACEAHALRGLSIARTHLPDELLRYCTSQRLAEILVGRVLGAAARRDLAMGRMEARDAFIRMARSWVADRLTDGETLARGRVVFATFEHGAGAPRDDAPGMRDALALPARDTILFEFAYDTDQAHDTRFPTIADAGRNSLFHPADEVEPNPEAPQTCTGWTRPLGGRPPQPELVHENETLRVLNRPPRYIGRIGA